MHPRLGLAKVSRRKIRGILTNRRPGHGHDSGSTFTGKSLQSFRSGGLSLTRELSTAPLLTVQVTAHTLQVHRQKTPSKFLFLFIYSKLQYSMIVCPNAPNSHVYHGDILL